MVKVTQICSNCGKTNIYKKSEYISREETKCKFCNHSLTITGGFTQSLIDEETLKKRRLVFWIIFVIVMLGISGLIFYGGFF